MNQTDFFITSMPASRPANYYLGWFEGSIFLDFDDYEGGLICLKRISFDGFGCCELGDKVTPMGDDDSQTFKQMIQSKIFNQTVLEQIIKKTILNNKNLIWEDALQAYNLV